MSKVNNKDTSYGVFVVKFGHISHLILVFLLLTLKMQLLAGLLYQNDYCGMFQSYGVKMDYFVNLIWADGSPSWSAARNILLPFLNKLSFYSKTY